MATTFLQVKDNAKSRVVSGALNNTTSPITISGFDTTSFPAVTTGFAVTIWDDVTYPDPGDDPNMEKALVTAATINASGSFTLTRGAPQTHSGTPRVALLALAQHISDIDTAVNTAENSLLTKVAQDTLMYNVLDHGAVGNGSTDDTAAIQALINLVFTMSPSGGWVTGPARTYIIDPNPGLQIKSNIKFSFPRGTVFKLKNGSIRNDNLIKSEGWSNFLIEGFTVDGNKANQSATTQYGVYVAGSINGIVKDIFVQNTTGVGVHSYNNTGVVFENIWSNGNAYHGFEIEQSINCTFNNVRGFSNTLHGMLVSPGEVSGTGSKGNNITNFTFDGNGQYGIAFNAANGDVSAWLCEGNKFSHGNVTNNGQYGINPYKQDKNIFENIYVANNGFFGIYGYQSSNNMWSNIMMHNNSQTTNNAYDEIFFEGAAAGHASTGNLLNNIKILVDGTNKARYAINEGAAGDSNVYTEVSIVGTPATGNTNISANTRYGHIDLTTAQTVGGAKTFSSTINAGQGISISPNAALQGTNMGVDAPFGVSALRFYNNNTSGNLQFVAPNGNMDMYIGGNNVFSVTSSYATMHGYPLQAVLDPVNPQDASTKAYTDTKATDSLAVHLAGAETITGAKTFTSAMATVDINSTGAIMASGVYNATPSVPGVYLGIPSTLAPRFTIVPSSGNVRAIDNNSGSLRFVNSTQGTVQLISDANGLFMFGSNISPTHTITLPSVSTGMALHNQVDQTTNYERFRMFWNSNVATIRSEAGGTGTLRSLVVSQGNISLTLNDGVSPKFLFTGGTTASILLTVNEVVTLSASTSIVQIAHAIQPTITQTGTAGYTMLLVNPTESTVGSGFKNLIDLQVGGVSRHRVDNLGNSVISSLATSGLTFYNTSDEVTNYERMVLSWSSNVFMFRAGLGGTGVARSMSFGTANRNNLFLLADSAGINGNIQLSTGTGTAGAAGTVVTGTWAATSGINPIVSINPTITQTVTAGYTALLVNVIESTTGSGSKLLADLQVGGIDKLTVDNSGNIKATGFASAVNYVAATSNRTTAVTLGGPASPGIEFCDATTAAFTLTLPSATVNTGITFMFKKTDVSVNAVTIATQASQTIDGAATYVLATQYKYVTVTSNGTNWFIAANN